MPGIATNHRNGVDPAGGIEGCPVQVVGDGLGGGRLRRGDRHMRYVRNVEPERAGESLAGADAIETARDDLES